MMMMMMVMVMVMVMAMVIGMVMVMLMLMLMLDADGWFDTGDLGMLLPDGSVVLTGRAKDTIVLSSGENIEPAPLEEELVSSPLIEQVMLVGQDQRQLGALIVPRAEAIFAWATT